MSKEKIEKHVSIRLPMDYHKFLKRLATDRGISQRDVLMQFIDYMRKKPAWHRGPLNDNDTLDITS